MLSGAAAVPMREATLLAVLLLLAGEGAGGGVRRRAGGGQGVLGHLLPPDYDRMTAPPSIEGQGGVIFIDLEVLGIPRMDEVLGKGRGHWG